MKPANNVIVKEEVMEDHAGGVPNVVPANTGSKDAICISISSGGGSDGSFNSRFSDSDDDDDPDDMEATSPRRKKPRVESVLPLGFLDPLPPHERALINSQIQTLSSSASHPTSTTDSGSGNKQFPLLQSCKQFWKAGDYEGTICAAPPSYSGNNTTHTCMNS